MSLYEGLCIEAGGIKGLDMLGALFEAFQLGKLKDVKVLCGSSVGSVLCYTLAIGYSPIDIFAFACRPEFIGAFRYPNFLNVKSLFGIYPNSILRTQLESLSRSKLGYCPTFKQIKEMLNKDLYITAFNLTTKEKIFFSAETHPDMIVVDAVTLSCNIPLIFEKAVYNDQVYIDGAFTSQFPIHCTEEKCPGPILGIKMKSRGFNPNDIFSYLQELVTLPLTSQVNEKGRDSTDIIELTESSEKIAFNFSLGIEDRIKAFNSGVKQAIAFFKKDQLPIPEK